MSLWKYWAFAVFTIIWFVIMADYFAGLPKGGNLDVAVTQGQVEAALAALTSEGGDWRAYHVWGTRTLDMLFPALLGAFLLTGLFRYVTPVFALGFGALVLGYVGVDYWENWTSLRLLETGEGVAANAWASLLKYLLLVVPLCIVLLGLVRETVKFVRTRPPWPHSG